MRPFVALAPVLCAVVVFGISGAARSDSSGKVAAPSKYYLPHDEALRDVTVTKANHAAKEIIVLTQAVAVKETGPKETLAGFGEVYAFSPPFIALRQEEPTMLTFWNLQPDDDHDFALLDQGGAVLMYQRLPPLKRTSYVFTFHR